MCQIYICRPDRLLGDYVAMLMRHSLLSMKLALAFVCWHYLYQLHPYQQPKLQCQSNIDAAHVLSHACKPVCWN